MKRKIFLLVSSVVLASAEEQPFETDFTPIQNAGNYSTLIDTILRTGMDEVISSNTPVTIFGPSNFAFSVFADQIAGISDQQLVDILLGHVIVNASITTEVLAREGCIVATAAAGQSRSIYRDPLTGAVDIDGVDVAISDVIGDYGVFYGIETVLVPGAIDFLGCPNVPDFTFSPIAETGRYSTLLYAMSETNTDFLIAVNHPVTIFGPTDSAFDTIIQGGDMNVSEIVPDHIVILRDISLSEIISSGCLDVVSAGGLRLAIRYDNTTNVTSINGIHFVDVDVIGGYGTFHGIDGVLSISDYSPCTDFSPMAEAGNYETLLNAITQTKMDEFIGQFAPVTIFGPTNNAFHAFQANNPSVIIDEQLIQQHIISIETIPFEFMARVRCYETVTTGGTPVDIRYDNATNTTTINGIPIVQVDVTGNYGVLHGIESVLFGRQYSPCADLSPIAKAGNYNVFLDAVILTRANEIISGFSPVTVFAPSDSAFAAVQDTLNDLSASKLVENILYHHMIIYQEIFSADVVASGCVDAETFGGSKVAIRYDRTTGTAIVNGIPIVELDIIANFGVVHGISGILNATASDAYTQCPKGTPTISVMPGDEPSEAPVARSAPTSDPIPATSSSAVSYLYAAFSAVIAMLVL